MSKYDTFKSIIADYKSLHFPYTKSKHWRYNLRELATNLAELNGKLWTLEPETEEHYVYVYLDPRKPGTYRYVLPSGKVVKFDYQPFYVGKGKDSRVDAHLKKDSLAKVCHKNSTFQAIRNAGFNPVDYREVTGSRKTDWLAQALEIDLIAGIGRADLKTGPLTNLTNGGEGSTGLIQSKEANTKRSKANKGRHFRSAAALEQSVRTRKARGSYTWSAETRERMRRAALNRKSRPLPKTYVCPHCKTKGKGFGMLRWHFDNCRSN